MTISKSIFTNLDALRLSPESLSLAGTTEVLTHVPIRKPARPEFVRINPDPAMTLATAIYDDKEERETFLVMPAMQIELVGELKPVLLCQAINRQNVVFIWPVPLPDVTGKRNSWSESARDAAELAKTHWVRMAADMSLGAYRVYRAEGALSEPVWPDRTLSELLEIAFTGRVIDRVDHPVIQRLRGLA
jgi:hypothetical protein